MKSYFLVGTYTDPALFGMGEGYGGKAEGVYFCSMEEGQITVLDRVRVVNPSFMAINEKMRRIYAVNELQHFRGEPGGGLTEISYDEEGRLAVEGQFSTCGLDPCHVAVSPAGDLVCVANYSSGRVTAFRLNEAGSVTGEKALFEHHGRGPHPVRQEGPHAHSILFDGKDGLYAVDLGLDQLKRYRLEKGTIVPDEAGTIVMKPGSGPRSAAWDPERRNLYVTNELDSSVTRLTVQGEKLIPMETVYTVPKGDEGENYCADVCLTADGRTLFVSNRGHDSIAVFRVGPDGRLTNAGWTSCGGRWPRSIALDPEGKWLLAANQHSDSITVFAVSEDGLPEQVSILPLPTPVCIRFFSEPPTRGR